MQCVAQGAPYVIGSLAALRVMGSRPRRRRADAADEATTSDRSDGVLASAGHQSTPADDASR
jgi:hypothetical protein